MVGTGGDVKRSGVRVGQRRLEKYIPGVIFDTRLSSIKNYLG